MRWNVEVSSIDNAPRGVGSGSVVLDAESWQRALQDARTQRGEDGSLSGFSIELLEEGYRAVDPVARLRYTVKRAPDDAPTLSTAGAPAGGTAPPPAKSPVSPASLSPPAAVPSAAPPRPSIAQALRPSASVAVAPPASVPSPTNGHSHPAPPPGGIPASIPAPAQAPVSVAAPSAAPVPASARVSQAQLAYEGSLPVAQLLSKREHDASERVPLTYREYVYCVAAGVNEQDAERLLRVELDRLKVAILRSRPGKFVNMAVFDVAFEGRPPVAPLVTLSWKDWRGAPVIGFPRRPVAVAASSAAPVGAAHPASLVGAPGAVSLPPAVTESLPSVVPPPASAPLPQAAAQGASWPPHAAPAKPLFAQQGGLTAFGVASDPFAAGTSPLPMGVPAPAGVSASPSGFPPPVATASVNAGPSGVNPGVAEASPAAATFPPPAAAPFAAPVSSRAPSRPGARAGAPRRRSSGDDLIADLFEAMHELHFCQDALEGGDFVLRLALDTIPSRLAIAHLYDIDRREFVVASVLGAPGEASASLLARREPESDPLLAAAMRARRAVLIDAAEDARPKSIDRYQATGGAKTILLSPVMKGGRYLGAVELIDPLDGAPYTANEGNALDYMSEQYAEFLAVRGVVVDAERISRQPAASYP